MGAEYDEVNRVLLQCERRLRQLQENGRLTMEGLREFVELSTRVRAEIDRRRLPDRRSVVRNTPERRAAAVALHSESAEHP